jgi:hypothetical protein
LLEHLLEFAHARLKWSVSGPVVVCIRHFLSK